MGLFDIEGLLLKSPLIRDDLCTLVAFELFSFLSERFVDGLIAVLGEFLEAEADEIIPFWVVASDTVAGIFLSDEGLVFFTRFFDNTSIETSSSFSLAFSIFLSPTACFFLINYFGKLRRYSRFFFLCRLALTFNRRRFNSLFDLRCQRDFL